MDFLSLSTALHSCQNILLEKEQWTFLRRQEVLLSLKDKLANYPLLGVGALGQDTGAVERATPAIGCDVNKLVK